MPKRSFPIDVFYDASCPLCAAEMAHVKTLDSNSEIRLIDCSAQAFFDANAAAAGVTQSAMMRLIHARSADGQWLIGVDVFIALYEHIGLPRVAGFWGHPLLGKVLRALYPTLAKYRQILSALGANRIYSSFITREARRALRSRCKNASCSVQQ